MAQEHKYIVLFSGDDSDFVWNQNVSINLVTEADLTGFKAHFSFMNFRQDFDEIPEDRKIVLTFPASATKDFPLGCGDAELWIEDKNGKRRTVANRIHVIVTRSVDEAYSTGDDQTISIGIINSAGPTEWGNIVKPFSPDSDEFDMDCNDWDLRKVVAKIFESLNGKVVNNED